MNFFAVFVITLFTGTAFVQGQENVDSNTSESWGGICQTGKKQSPIDIAMDTVKPKDLDLCLNNYVDKKYCAKIRNVGYTVELRFSKNDNDGVLPSLEGSGLPGKYILSHIHFRWQSEHTLNGKKYPLEAQLIHVWDKYNSGSEAHDKENGLALLATLFEVSDEGDEDISKTYDEIINAIPNTPSDEPKTVCGLDVGDFLPDDFQDFFRYNGSIPHKTCDESVIWTVFRSTLEISTDQYEKLIGTKGTNGNSIKSNSRPTQPLNGREILYSEEHNN